MAIGRRYCRCLILLLEEGSSADRPAGTGSCSFMLSFALGAEQTIFCCAGHRQFNVRRAVHLPQMTDGSVFEGVFHEAKLGENASVVLRMARLVWPCSAVASVTWLARQCWAVAFGSPLYKALPLHGGAQSKGYASQAAGLGRDEVAVRLFPLLITSSHALPVPQTQPARSLGPCVSLKAQRGSQAL